MAKRERESRLARECKARLDLHFRNAARRRLGIQLNN